ncbi:helix-turn-helix transcriptional regulator [Nitrospirillum sp. BR 11163]|uniref:helix-turn-helix domain-containing protein n=1 Tax=Nitrospirillum sp. BR 11163 TaxID=3104323 RepID=UPI002AFFC5F0|nr:helix-turn-helix transcriptional regulator [Nitrospirillum sp. BR 11163]MEA1674369.1 helix-turn-helix transcriptional regulator [Nitrospirillum sp. BR 11163]
MNDLRTILADNLRRLRKAKGISQEELAGLAEVDRTYISLIERKRNSISLDKLEQIAVALNVQAYVLIKPDVD